MDDFVINFSYEEWENKYLTSNEISDIINTERGKENKDGNN